MTDVTPSLRGWMRWLLVASLTLNLLIIGLAVGVMMRFGSPEHGAPRSLGPVLYQELPRADRKAMRQAMGPHGKRTASHSDRARSAQMIGVALRADPFEPQALKAAVEGETSNRATRQADLQAAWLDRVSGMSPQDRAAYADRVEAALLSRKRGRERAR